VIALATWAWILIAAGAAGLVVFVLAIWFYPRDNSF